MSTYIYGYSVSSRAVDFHNNMLINWLANGVWDVDDAHYEAFIYPNAFELYTDQESEAWLSEAFGSVFNAIDFVKEYDKITDGSTDINIVDIVEVCSFAIGEHIIEEIGCNTLDEYIDYFEVV